MCAFLMFIIAILAVKMKPCLIPKINVLETPAYIIIMLINICGLLIKLYPTNLVRIIAISSMVGLSISTIIGTRKAWKK